MAGRPEKHPGPRASLYLLPQMKPNAWSSPENTIKQSFAIMVYFPAGHMVEASSLYSSAKAAVFNNVKLCVKFMFFPLPIKLFHA